MLVGYDDFIAEQLLLTIRELPERAPREHDTVEDIRLPVVLARTGVGGPLRPVRRVQGMPRERWLPDLDHRPAHPLGEVLVLVGVSTKEEHVEAARSDDPQPMDPAAACLAALVRREAVGFRLPRAPDG